MNFLAFLHIAFLPFHQLEGFLTGLSRYIPKLKAADYTTIFKRLKRIKIEFPLQEIDNDVILAMDSTGMNVSSRGEWIRHKWKVKKGWVKVHIAVDVKTKKLLALEITDEGVGMKNVTTIDKTSQKEWQWKVREAREIGYEGWKDKYKYGNGWAAETFFSGIKRTFGETSRAKSIEGVFQEVKLKFLFYNMLLSL